jgi:hypothetical protein
VRSRSPNTRATCAAWTSCLQRLEARRRTLIRTAFFDGATYEELARRTDTPVGTGEKLDPTRPPPTPHVPRSMNSDDDKLRDDADDGNDVSAAEYVLGTMDARSARPSPNASRANRCSHAKLPPGANICRRCSTKWSPWCRRCICGIGCAPAPAFLVTDPLPAGTGRQRLWDRLAFWRGVGFAGLAATAACVIALIAMPRPGLIPVVPHSALPHPVRLVATMADGKGRATFMAARRRRCLHPRAHAAGSQAGTGPGAASVGAPGRWRAAFAGRRRRCAAAGDEGAGALRDGILRGGLQSTASLAVSMEPPGGSPTGQPHRLHRGPRGR